MNYNNDLYSRNRNKNSNNININNNNSNNNNNNIQLNNDISNNYNSNNTNLFNKSYQNNSSYNGTSSSSGSNSSIGSIISNIPIPIILLNYLNKINNNQWVQYIKRIYKKLYVDGKLKKIILIIQVLILFLLLQHTLNKFQRTDDSDSTLIRYRNNLCGGGSGVAGNGNGNDNNNNIYHDGYLEVFNKKRINEILISNNIDREVLCHSGQQYQFKKFIWLFVDSLAHDQAYDMIESFKENSNVYRVLNHGFKFSTAIYTTFFTGKIPTNYAGKPIQSDNIFYQMKRAGNKMHFVGPEFPAPSLLADSPSTHRYFDEFTIVPDEISLFTQLFGEVSPFTNLLTATEDSVSQRLDALSSSGTKSVMLTTNLLDDKIHRNGKTHPPTLKLLDGLAKNIPLIKKWLADHPDYLFILNSDHGGSKTGGTHEGELHGMKDNGNEGFFLFYNKQFIQPITTVASQIDNTAGTRSSNNHPDRPWLDTVDVAPTIVKYFKDVNIPLESLGLVGLPPTTSSSSITFLDQQQQQQQQDSINNGNGNNNNLTSIYIDLLINAIQIRELSILKGFPFKEYEFERAISLGTSFLSNAQPQLIQEKIEQLREFIISIKEPMVDFKKFPLNYLIFIGIIIIIIQIINLKIEFSQNDLILLLKNNLLPTVIPYFFIYIDFLFLKFDYHKHFTNVFTFYITLIPIVILYLIYNLILDKLNNNNNNSNSSTSNNNSFSSNSNSNNEDYIINDIDIISQPIPIPLYNQQHQPVQQQQQQQQQVQQDQKSQVQQSQAQQSSPNGTTDEITTTTTTATSQQQQQVQTQPQVQTQQQQQVQQTQGQDSQMEQVELFEQLESQPQQQYQQQQQQQQQIQLNEININFEIEWLNNLFYNIFYVMATFVASHFIMEFLPMVYEGLQSFSFYINYFILYWILYVLVIMKTQLLSNYINNSSGSVSTSSNSSGIGFYNLVFNNPIKVLNTNQSRLAFIKYGGVYFSMITLCLFYDISGIPSIMQLCYLIMLVQVIVMIIGIYGSFVDELSLVASLLLFAVSTDNQRFYLLVILLPQLYLLSNTYSSGTGAGSGWKLSLQTFSFNGKLKSLSRMISLFMIVLTIKSYIFMGGTFNMNVDVRAGNIGLLNMEDYPTFSGFLMVFHKLGYFFILITFLFKFVKSSSSSSSTSNNESSFTSSSSSSSSSFLANQQLQQQKQYQIQDLYDSLELKSWLFRILAQKSIVLMWIFNLNFWQYKDYLDCFITTLIISIITIGFGVCLCFDELSKYLKPKVWKLINRNNLTY